jgi:predicted nucleic acid-binding protein
MSLYENNDNPYEARRLSIADFFKHASLFVNYEKAEKIEAKAGEIMGCRIRNKDAIHIACAIEAGCAYFITTDDDLGRRYAGNEITVCNPVDFIRVLEGQDE